MSISGPKKPLFIIFLHFHYIMKANQTWTKKGLLNCLMLENIEVQPFFKISILNFASKSDFAGCFTSPLFLLLPKVITWKARGVFWNSRHYKWFRSNHSAHFELLVVWYFSFNSLLFVGRFLQKKYCAQNLVK